jgi:lysophospholipid acyltransferase (LPLAT)-like uncharacterized protein
LAKSGRRRSRWRTLRRAITRSEPFLAAVTRAATTFIVAYARTLRVRVEPPPGRTIPERALYGFWHGRQFLLVPTFRDRDIAILADLSWAGEIQARILARLGYHVVRGSSRRNPNRALVAMARALESGRPGAFALDGPRGPIHQSKPGILFLARKLGLPVVPLTTSARRAWAIPGTWCRYLLPLPFTECLVVAGPPLTPAVDDSLDSSDLDAAVSSLTERADREAGRRACRSDAAGRGAPGD